MGKSMRMMVAAVCAAVLATACAGISPRDRMAERLEEYRAAAGEPVPHFRYFRLRSWEPLGDRALAVYTHAHEAWLLELDAPCSELVFATAIGLSSSVGHVHARFDRVYAGRDRVPCRIQTIQSVDVKQLRAAAAKRRTIEQVEREADTGE